MATISINYDSNGDVELILGMENTCLKPEAQKALLSTKQEESPPRMQEGPSSNKEDPASGKQEEYAKYSVGPLSIITKEIRLRVSSLKLISSSRYFQGMFEGPAFCERKELIEHGFVEIELLDPDDDPTAMMIILGILYETSTQVPPRLDLQMLYKVTVLVDKYQWHTLVAPHAISWFDGLVDSQGLPDKFDQTLLMWLWIAWIFERKYHFKVLSRVAQQDACNSIDLTDESIRLSTRTLKAINEQREAAFLKIEQVIQAFQKQLLGSEIQKTNPIPVQERVKYMVFGFATFSSQYLKVGEFSLPDHAGSSVRSLKNSINSLPSVRGFAVTSPTGGVGEIINGGIWDLENKLQTAMNDLKMDDWGLEYDDFKPRAICNQQNRVLDS
ncbi:hypothetical protein F5884DRAFT_711969 [Xylogone sp. PMI_703]|nr:hypothetical protein F5884DRAFT_711969 [Xylogone sp. PMI_703]